MRKKVMPAIVAVIFVIVIGLIAVLTMVIQKYIPSNDPSDLKSYYCLKEEDDIAVVFNNTITGEVCKYWDGHVYMTYEYVHDTLNERFYWDGNENILRYTTPSDLISVNAGSNQFTVGKSPSQEAYTRSEERRVGKECL